MSAALAVEVEEEEEVWVDTRLQEDKQGYQLHVYQVCLRHQEFKYQECGLDFHLAAVLDRSVVEIISHPISPPAAGHSLTQMSKARSAIPFLQSQGPSPIPPLLHNRVCSTPSPIPFLSAPLPPQ